MRRKQRLIIDTNLWVSFLLSKKFNFIDSLLDSRKVELVLCEELIEELIEVISRPKLSSFFSTKDRNLLFEIIERYSIYVDIVSSVTACRDSKDNFLLSLSVDAKADYLLTGDKDLLVLNPFGVTKIVTITDYKNAIT